MDRRMIDDDQEEHNVGSLDTSMDRYLEYLQLWRKRIPQDGSSLFRAFSEALFSTQVHHYDVRLACIAFMRLYAEDFSPLIKMPFDKYLTHLKDPTTPGGMLEVEALARCYRVTIVVYSGRDHDPVECRYGAKKIMLSLIGYQFDRVITEERRRLLGIVQAYVYKFLYSEVFNQPKVVEEAKAKLRKSDTLYYGVKGAGMIKNSDRSEKKPSHDPIPVPYRTAKAFEPAIYRNVAYDVYMNDHFKKYLDRTSNKQHQHIPFMAHNRLVERFGVKMHLPVSYLNPPDCRRVIVTLSNAEELFAYYVGEDADTNMHNVFLVKFGSMTKTTEERMLDFPASLGRRPVTFAQLKQHTSLYRKLKPCLDASAQFFEERSSRRQRQQTGDYPVHQPGPTLRPYPPLMSSGSGSVMYSPPLDNYSPSPNWFSSSNSSHPALPILIPMNNPDQIQLQHRLSINVTDHYECTAHPNHLYPTYSTTTTTTSTTNSSAHDAMSLNGSLGSGTSTTDGSPYPLLAPMPTVFFNPYQQAMNNDQHSATPYLSPTMFFPSALSPRLVAETRQSTIINEPLPTKFLPGQSPIVMMSSSHPMVNTAPPPPPPTMSNFHPISLVPRFYVDPATCSSPMPNVYLSNGQSSGGTYPLFCSSTPTAHLSSWIPTGPPMTSAGPPMPYFLPASHPPAPHFPFQQLIQTV